MILDEVFDADSHSFLHANLLRLLDSRGATKNSSEDQDPRWSPNGKEIVFQSNRDGKWQIYSVINNLSS